MATAGRVPREPDDSLMKRRASRKPRRSHAQPKSRRWSAQVTQHSNAHKIALSLKRSAESSKRRKGTPYQSAMSMLNFYINRAGKNLPTSQKQTLQRAKG